MRPVFEHALVEALRLPQIRAPIIGDAAIENVMMAALDHIDGVDLHIAEMIHGGGDRLRPVAERVRRIEPLGTQPDSPGLGLGQGMGWIARGIARQCNRIRREESAIR